MTNKAQKEQTYFHCHKNSRLSNPTYISHFVQDSLSLYSPQHEKAQPMKKSTEYKSNFEPLTDKINVLNPPTSFHFGRISQQALQRNKSYLSQYGSSLITSHNYEKKN